MTHGPSDRFRVPLNHSKGYVEQAWPASYGCPTMVSLPRCGEPAAVLAAAPGLLEVTAAFPAEVDQGGDATFTGTVTITATTRPVVGVTTTDADLYVTQAGTVVATPMAKDLLAVPVRLLPGSSRALMARGSLRACAPHSDRLPPGRYDVFAVVVVTDDAGETITATGGPWSLTVT